jgi:hypothetical protein
MFTRLLALRRRILVSNHFIQPCAKRATTPSDLSAALGLLACLFWFAIPTCLASESGAEIPTIQVAARESLEMYGPLISAILRESGTAPVLKFYPTARSRNLFASGSVDAEFFRITKLPPDYPPDVIRIGPLQSVRFGMFIRANDPQGTGKPPEYLWQQSLGTCAARWRLSR